MLWLILGVVLIMAFGKMLAPVFASVIVAYLLEGSWHGWSDSAYRG